MDASLIFAMLRELTFDILGREEVTLALIGLGVVSERDWPHATRLGFACWARIAPGQLNISMFMFMFILKPTTEKGRKKTNLL